MAKVVTIGGDERLLFDGVGRAAPSGHDNGPWDLASLLMVLKNVCAAEGNEKRLERVGRSLRGDNKGVSRLGYSTVANELRQVAKRDTGVLTFHKS